MRRVSHPARAAIVLVGVAGLGALALAALVLARGPEKFTIILLPDTQYYAEKHPDILADQVDWILDQQAPRNIVFVAHVGDIVEHFDNEDEWQVAEEQLSRLIGTVPLGLLPGNHDMSPAGEAVLFNRHFGPGRFAGLPGFGGSFPEGTNNNNYHLFEAGGYRLGPFTFGADRFVVLELSFCPEPDVVAWARQVLEKYADRHAIVVTHGYLGVDGRRHVGQPDFGCSEGEGNTEYLFDELIYPNPNVFLVLSGHQYDTQSLDGEARRDDRNVAGRWVYQLVSDYQRRPEGGGGWLRILGFNQEQGRLIVRTYSPKLRSYEQDADSDFWVPYPAPLP